MDADYIAPPPPPGQRRRRRRKDQEDWSGATCPIPAAHDKLAEAHYFLIRMLQEFHVPEEYRWNLSAFLQALRSVTLLLQSELGARAGFAEWYSPWQERLKADSLLRRMVEGRNIVVHKGQLKRRSKVELGRFMGRDLRMGLTYELDVDIPSQQLLVDLVEVGLFGTTDYYDGEQFGLLRTWIADDLCEGEEDVTDVCDRAFRKLSDLISDAHSFCGSHWENPEGDHVHAAARVNTLFELDLDKDILQKAKAKARRRVRAVLKKEREKLGADAYQFPHGKDEAADP